MHACMYNTMQYNTILHIYTPTYTHMHTYIHTHTYITIQYRHTHRTPFYVVTDTHTDKQTDTDTEQYRQKDTCTHTQDTILCGQRHTQTRQTDRHRTPLCVVRVTDTNTHTQTIQYRDTHTHTGHHFMWSHRDRDTHTYNTDRQKDTYTHTHKHGTLFYVLGQLTPVGGSNLFIYLFFVKNVVPMVVARSEDTVLCGRG